jgi:sulfur carrier protein
MSNAKQQSKTILIRVNGEERQITAQKLSDFVEGYGDGALATALNGQFVAKDQRDAIILKQNDALEIVAPMQGG